MSRLGGLGGGVKDRALPGASSLSQMGMVAAAILLILAVIGTAIIAAAVYSMLASGALSSSSPPAVSSTTVSSTTSTIASFTTTSTTTTTTSSTLVSSTTTSSTTTSTLSKDTIAFCMRSRMNEIFVYGSSLPSVNLKNYLSGYAALFSYTDCSTDEDKKTCTETMRAYANDSSLYLPNGKSTTVILYPVVILSKDNAAHIVPSVGEFEKLMDCGSLKNSFNSTRP
ncbi:MAG: hypothetical protein V1875_03040 [Candidatus Altiarchaeota archaeon]